MQEKLDPPLLDENMVAEFLKRFTPLPASKAKEEEIKQLKRKFEEQEVKIKEMGRYTRMILEERDELRKDRQEAWDALKEERKALKNMTERKNGYRMLSRGTKRRRDAGAEHLWSDESDSEEEIPREMKIKYHAY
ncbi:hypothetical protein DL98DRAFT_597405 [Cadophora sp. DSE1049]|nr:hypothetical protein DL98DRAFT_597405 [Cadophora sp. DSE1049]